MNLVLIVVIIALPFVYIRAYYYSKYWLVHSADVDVALFASHLEITLIMSHRETRDTFYILIIDLLIIN
jgi:hypothetical protein